MVIKVGHGQHLRPSIEPFARINSHFRTLKKISDQDRRNRQLNNKKSLTKRVLPTITSSGFAACVYVPNQQCTIMYIRVPCHIQYKLTLSDQARASVIWKRVSGHPVCGFVQEMFKLYGICQGKIME